MVVKKTWLRAPRNPRPAPASRGAPSPLPSADLPRRLGTMPNRRTARILPGPMPPIGAILQDGAAGAACPLDCRDLEAATPADPGGSASPVASASSRVISVLSRQSASSAAQPRRSGPASPRVRRRSEALIHGSDSQNCHALVVLPSPAKDRCPFGAPWKISADWKNNDRQLRLTPRRPTRSACQRSSACGQWQIGGHHPSC